MLKEEEKHTDLPPAITLANPETISLMHQRLIVPRNFFHREKPTISGANLWNEFCTIGNMMTI